MCQSQKKTNYYIHAVIYIGTTTIIHERTFFPIHISPPPTILQNMKNERKKKKTENRTSKIDILLHHGMYIHLDKIRGQNVLVCIVLILHNKKSSKI